MTSLPRSGFLRAALASACALALLAASPAPRSARAQEAASAVQDVTLQDLVLEAGGTRFVAPRLTASGTRLSKDDLLAILKADGKAPWAARLARLDAGSLAIPELRVEREVGGVRQVATYRDVVAKGVHGGRIGELTSSGATVSVGGEAKGTGTYGKMRAEDLDLAALARLSVEAGDGKGPLQRTYAAFSVEDVAFTDESGTRVSIARLGGRDLAARQLPATWTGAVDAFRTFDKALEGDDPALHARAAGQAADLIEGLSIGSLEATGLRVQGTERDAPVEMTVGRLAYDAAAEAGLSLADLTFTGASTRMSLAKAALSGASLAPTIATLRRMTKPGAVTEAELRRLTPMLGTLKLSGFSLDLPTEAKGGSGDGSGTDGGGAGKEAGKGTDKPAPPLDPLTGTGPDAGGARLHVALRDAVMTFAPPKDGVPVSSRLTFSGLTLPASAVAGVPGLAALGSYGYRDLDLDLVVDSAWDEATKEIALREISLAGKDMGTLRINGTLGGIGPEVFDPDAAVSGFAMLSATAKALDLTLVNGGLYERFIETQSKALSLKPDELRKEYVTACLIGVPVILGNSAAAKTLGAALGKFAAKPGTLSISARAKNGTGLGVVDFSTVATPGALLDKLDVTAQAE